ncbi:hypothetical protein ACWKWU_14265 [Chitinophaga lutea]
MKTEQFTIQIRYRNREREFPVLFDSEGIYCRLCVKVDDKDICFGRDGHGRMQALSHQEDFDPEFLYQLARGIEQQRAYA